MRKLKYPIGISDFAEMRNNGYSIPKTSIRSLGFFGRYTATEYSRFSQRTLFDTDLVIYCTL